MVSSDPLPIPFLLPVRKHGGSLVISLNHLGAKPNMVFEGTAQFVDKKLKITLIEANEK